MSCRVTVHGAQPDEELLSLLAWTSADPLVAPYVRREQQPGMPGSLGSTSQMLIEAAAGGGSSLAVARCFVAWLRTRKSDVHLSIRGSTGELEIRADNIEDAEALITRFLESR